MRAPQSLIRLGVARQSFGQKKAAHKARPVNREETPRKGSGISDAAQGGLYGAAQRQATIF
jgi:hypothetical protein